MLDRYIMGKQVLYSSAGSREPYFQACMLVFVLYMYIHPNLLHIHEYCLHSPPQPTKGVAYTLLRTFLIGLHQQEAFLLGILERVAEFSIFQIRDRINHPPSRPPPL
jgi:hypothetical protein